MLSLPDFTEKQLVFVQAEWGKPSVLRVYNDNIVFEKDKKVVNRVSLHKVFAVFVCGDLSLSTGFLRKTKDHGISVFLLKHNLELYASISASAEGHYLLRQKQYTLDTVWQLTMAKQLISNKTANQLALLQQKKDQTHYKETLTNIGLWRNQIVEVDDEETLLGLEGVISKEYFSAYFHDLGWYRRAPRTREDVTNLLLDTGYTFLFNFVDALLRLHGFDTYKGFYHKLFFQRKSLACDLVEPLRCIIDKQIVKAHNLGQVKEKDFIFKNGSFEYLPEQRSYYTNLLLQSLMDKKDDIFAYVHGFYQHIMNPNKYPFPIFTHIK